MSAIGPLVIGVMVAFGWNVAASHQAAVTGADSGVTPAVGLTVEQAAAQAWASSTPFSVRGGAAGPGAPGARGEPGASGGSPRASGRARPAGHSRESGRPAGECGRAWSPHLMQAHVTFTCPPQRPGGPVLPGAGQPREVPQDTSAAARLYFR